MKDPRYDKTKFLFAPSDTLLFSAHSSINFNTKKTNRESEYKLNKVSRWKKGNDQKSILSDRLPSCLGFLKVTVPLTSMESEKKKHAFT